MWHTYTANHPSMISGKDKDKVDTDMVDTDMVDTDMVDTDMVDKCLQMTERLNPRSI